MRRVLPVFLILTFLAVAPVMADKIYWIDGDTIQRANLDGTFHQILRRRPAYPGGLALDVEHGKMYWHDKQDIYRSNLDGTNATRLLDLCGCRKFAGLGLDLVAGDLYWIETGMLDPGDNAYRSHLYRIDLDAPEPEWVESWESAEVMDVVVDSIGRKVYWSEDSGFAQPQSSIHRMNLDGTGLQTVIGATDGVQITCLGLDEIERRLYWGARDPGSAVSEVMRADLDGSNVEQIVVDPASPATGIALDTRGRKLYWTDHLEGDHSGRIRRSNVDGSDVEDVMTGLDLPADVTFDPRPGARVRPAPAARKAFPRDGFATESLELRPAPVPNR